MYKANKFSFKWIIELNMENLTNKFMAQLHTI